MTSIRDLTCIHSVAHMAEYGKYEEEFIVYGCACLEQDKIVYRISPFYEEIARFLEKANLKGSNPSPVHTFMNRCIVQTGQKDALLYETEIHLAKMLRERYSRLFFEQIEQCSNVNASNIAKVIFDELQFQLHGVFSEDYLQLFEGLVRLAYQAKLLTTETLEEIQQWLKKMNLQLEDEVAIKMPFQRTFYGFSYLDQEGKPHYKLNAQVFSVVSEQRKMIQKQYCVTPVFQKVYSYDYGIEPKTVREKFKKLLETYYGTLYWSYWKQIKMLPAVVQKDHFEKAVQLLATSCSQDAQQALQEYGYAWNLYPLLNHS